MGEAVASPETPVEAQQEFDKRKDQQGQRISYTPKPLSFQPPKETKGVKPPVASPDVLDAAELFRARGELSLEGLPDQQRDAIEEKLSIINNTLPEGVELTADQCATLTADGTIQLDVDRLSQSLEAQGLDVEQTTKEVMDSLAHEGNYTYGYAYDEQGNRGLPIKRTKEEREKEAQATLEAVKVPEQQALQEQLAELKQQTQLEEQPQPEQQPQSHEEKLERIKELKKLREEQQGQTVTGETQEERRAQQHANYLGDQEQAPDVTAERQATLDAVRALIDERQQRPLTAEQQQTLEEHQEKAQEQRDTVPEMEATRREHSADTVRDVAVCAQTALENLQREGVAEQSHLQGYREGMERVAEEACQAIETNEQLAKKAATLAENYQEVAHLHPSADLEYGALQREGDLAEIEAKKAALKEHMGQGRKEWGQEFDTLKGLKEQKREERAQKRSAIESTVEGSPELATGLAGIQRKLGVTGINPHLEGVIANMNTQVAQGVQHVPMGAPQQQTTLSPTGSPTLQVSEDLARAVGEVTQGINARVDESAAQHTTAISEERAAEQQKGGGRE